ncbi:hypothetical protein ACIGO9_30460 [Nocardia asteroides]|uniref:hypothetical protein n=1 Tax=Nocardia asteroides TaxID=1824 RepID=UPI0037C57464
MADSMQPPINTGPTSRDPSQGMRGDASALQPPPLPESRAKAAARAGAILNARGASALQLRLINGNWSPWAVYANGATRDLNAAADPHLIKLMSELGDPSDTALNGDLFSPDDIGASRWSASVEALVSLARSAPQSDDVAPSSPATTALTVPVATERVSTDKLRVGDVVHDEGMVLVIDLPITRQQAGRVSFATSALISNWDELVDQARRDVADRILNSAAVFITRRATDGPDGSHRWTIQGNDLETWWRVVPDPAGLAVAEAVLAAQACQDFSLGSATDGAQEAPVQQAPASAGLEA